MDFVLAVGVPVGGSASGASLRNPAPFRRPCVTAPPASGVYYFDNDFFGLNHA